MRGWCFSGLRDPDKDIADLSSTTDAKAELLFAIGALVVYLGLGVVLYSQVMCAIEPSPR